MLAQQHEVEVLVDSIMHLKPSKEKVQELMACLDKRSSLEPVGCGLLECFLLVPITV